MNESLYVWIPKLANIRPTQHIEDTNGSKTWINCSSSSINLAKSFNMTHTTWCFREKYPKVFFCFWWRFVQYKATSLEKQHKHDLLTEPDLGVTIDLINPDTYRIDPTSKKTSFVLFTWYVQIKRLCVNSTNLFKLSVLLDPADEKLLEEDIQAPSSSKR